MSPRYRTLKKVSLRNHPALNEAWVEEQVKADPSILGLGELEVKDSQRIQIGNGRLDLLLRDPESLKRFEVELQLGKTDEAHIIRTIEYWDIEKKRYPQYEHAAVIVAEEITSRFFNVIGLFNGFIPVIAIQMTAYEIEQDVGLAFVTVLDERQLGLVEEDEEVQIPADRPYWDKRASKATMGMADQTLGLIHKWDPDIAFKYNKYYIGLSKDGQRANFVQFRPKKQWLDLNVKLERSEEYEQLLENEELEVEYEARRQRYKIRLGIGDLQKHEVFVDNILQLAAKQNEEV